MELSEKIDALLSQVEKPVRYMGGEFGSVMKDLGTVDVRYAFLFPDVYEVGMSHLGMKILYHAINRMDGAWCERVFSPWVDMDAKMREAGVPLFSLESRTPVREFDLLGITLQYEMCYTNILSALDLADLGEQSQKRPVCDLRRSVRVQSGAIGALCGCIRHGRRGRAHAENHRSVPQMARHRPSARKIPGDACAARRHLCALAVRYFL